MEDSESGRTTSSVRGIPRPSRLPRARGAANNGDGTGATILSSRPSEIVPTKLVPTARSSSGENKAGVSRFGWKAHGVHEHQEMHNRPPANNIDIDATTTAGKATVREEVSDVRVDSVYVSPTGNPEVSGPIASTENLRKKPRPSLSERTIETMSHVPPSPSPSRRKSSISAATVSMPPPLRPVSPASRRSPYVSGLTSPSVQSPSRLVPPVPFLRPSNSGPTVHTTPVRAQPQDNYHNTASSIRVGSEASSYRQITNLTPKTAPAAHKAKSMRDLRSSARQPVRKVSLNFKDIRILNKDEPSGTSTTQTSNAAAKPRIPSTSTPSRLRKRPSILDKKERQASEATQEIPAPKSSASLRDTIAKAKAAKKQAILTRQPNVSDSTDNISASDQIPGTSIEEGISTQSLKRRLQNAVSTGVLNVAALGLKTIPADILNMYDLKEGSQLNWSEAVDLTKFIVADNEIKELPEAVFPDWSIQELQDDENKSNIFGGLEILDFRGNELSQVPIGLRRLERLHTLNLSNNKLTCDVFEVVSQLPALRDISLAKNDLQGSLPTSVSQLVNLSFLDVHENKLTDLGHSFSSLSKLRKLNVSSNLLTTLPMTDLEQLHITDIDASRNRISKLIFSSGSAALEVMQNLNISFNNVHELWSDKIQFPQLQSLMIDSNSLERMPNVSGFRSLVTLTVSDNRLGDIPDGFTELQSLRTANFSGNDVRILDPYISKMENLTALTLGGNPLRERKYLNMTTSDLKTDLAKRLTAVYVREDNNTTPTAERSPTNAEPSNPYKVEKGLLNLSARGLAAVDCALLDHATTVHSIDLSQNKLPAFPLELLCHGDIWKSLKTLTLSHNAAMEPASYISSTLDLPNLRSLSLDSTGIASTDALTTYMSCPALTDLNLSCNRLSGPVPSLKRYFPALTSLLIPDNQLTSITPDSVAGLEVVDIRNNEIEFLPPKIGELGNIDDEKRPGRLRTFECAGNRFRVPRLVIVEKGTEAILRDLRRMVITGELVEEWQAT